MRIKKNLVLHTLILSITILAACKVSTNTQITKEKAVKNVYVQAEKKTVLRMAWWGSQLRHDKTVEVIRLYEKQNPGIDIQYEFYDFDEYFAKLNTLVASDNIWDCFQMGGNFPAYANKIAPLDKYIKLGIIDTSKTTDAFLKTTQNKGIQIGISNGVNCYGIAYDPAMFAKAGIAEPARNWTWKDYYNDCITIHKKLGIYGSSQLDDFIAGCTAGVPQSDKNLQFFAMSNDKLGFNDYSLLVDYIKMRANLVGVGAYPDPGAIDRIRNIEEDYLVTREAAMTWVASNQFIALSEAAGRELKLVPIPRKKADGNAGFPIQSSQMFCISKHSKYPEEAAKFLNFLWTDEVANKILGGERGISIFSNVINAQAAPQNQKQKYVNDFVKLVGSFKTGDVNVISPKEKIQIEHYYRMAIQKVIYKEMTAEEAAKDFYQFAKAEFK